MIKAAIAAEMAESFRVLPGRADAGIILLCDHASNALPKRYGTLGLSPDQLERHIAYDIGAAAITERLAARLGAPAVLSRHSRLLIDINRGEDDPTLLMRLSDGAVIPGNHNLSQVERNARVERYWRPYHTAVGRVVAACRASGPPPLIFSVHSMTHVWKGVPRPWHVSILWNEDRRLAGPVLEAFAANPARVVGDNVPYHGGLEGDTIWQHARPYGLANAVIEYRQDLVADAAGQIYWADETYDILADILGIAKSARSPHIAPIVETAAHNGAPNDDPRTKIPDRIGSSGLPSLGGPPA